MKPNKTIDKKELDALVKALSQGSVAAYSTIYRLYYPRLYRYGLQISRDPAFVEDILQDLFTYLAENCRKLRRVSNFEVYLFQSVKRNIFTRLAREQQSRNSRDRYRQRTEPLEDQFAPAPDEALIADESAARRSARLRAAMAELPDHQREILYLRYFEEMSYQEICQILDLNHQVARNYTSRAIRQLKKALLNLELQFILLFFSILSGK
ncbi:RNA polymerase sigma factor [Flavilitoribacter nigricans]|uniref:RNA polymerase sigma factor n=1 Tax=Flavilitoribacter nigricans TaxID=70997 RepID=UPI0014763DC1|nr:sigma-70 family RNA polymerase sigma factor [Flavilitoribacter nigricans]